MFPVAQASGEASGLRLQASGLRPQATVRRTRSAGARDPLALEAGVGRVLVNRLRLVRGEQECGDEPAQMEVNLLRKEHKYEIEDGCHSISLGVTHQAITAGG